MCDNYSCYLGTVTTSPANMPKITKCWYKDCDSDNRKVPKLLFYKFPRDLDRCEKWVRNCGNDQLTSIWNENPDKLAALRVCQEHFLKEFLGSSSRLVGHAVPAPYGIPIDQLDVEQFMVDCASLKSSANLARQTSHEAEPTHEYQQEQYQPVPFYDNSNDNLQTLDTYPNCDAINQNTNYLNYSDCATQNDYQQVIDYNHQHQAVPTDTGSYVNMDLANIHDGNYTHHNNECQYPNPYVPSSSADSMAPPINDMSSENQQYATSYQQEEVQQGIAQQHEVQQHELQQQGIQQQGIQQHELQQQGIQQHELQQQGMQQQEMQVPHGNEVAIYQHNEVETNLHANEYEGGNDMQQDIMNITPPDMDSQQENPRINYDKQGRVVNIQYSRETVSLIKADDKEQNRAHIEALKHKIRFYQRKLAVKTHRYQRLKTLTTRGQSHKTRLLECLKQCKADFSPCVFEIFRRQIKRPSSKQGNRWSDDVKSFSSAIYLRSKSAYMFIRKSIDLPSESIVKSYISEKNLSRLVANELDSGSDRKSE